MGECFKLCQLPTKKKSISGTDAADEAVGLFLTVITRVFWLRSEIFSLTPAL